MTAALRLFAGGWLILLLTLQPAYAQRWGAGISGAVTLSPEAVDGWVPFAAPNAALVTVHATINGQPVLALVDTGAPYTAMDAGWAQQHGIKLARTVAAGRNQVSVYVGTIHEMKLGPITQSGGRLSAIDLSPMRQAMGIPITMVLGADYLRTLAVSFDFDRARLGLHPSDSTRPPGVTVPLSMAYANRFIIGMRVGAVPVERVLIDTGIDATLSVTLPVWKRLPLAGVRVSSTQGHSLYGNLYWDVARFDGVAIGAAPLPGRLEILASGDRILDTPADALIGMEALRYHNLFLDARTGVMILSPRTTPHRAPPISTIGVLGSGHERGFEVLHVMRHSPAAAAGIVAGDIICSVEGKSIARGSPGSRENWAARPLGTILSLGLCSGRTVSITLAEFY